MKSELDLNSKGTGKMNQGMADFEIKNLRVGVEGREILKGVSLSVNKGEVHAVMGPNGSGKSTLSYTLMGHPNYKVLEGEVLFKGQDVLKLQPEERAKLGMFLALQYPIVVPGITMSNFLRPRSTPSEATTARTSQRRSTSRNFVRCSKVRWAFCAWTILSSVAM